MSVTRLKIWNQFTNIFAERKEHLNNNTNNNNTSEGQ